MTAVTTLTALPSSDGRIYTKYPLGDRPFGIDTVNSYVFGHSLYTYDGGDTAPNTDWTRVGTWLGLFAANNAKNYRGEGDFGQAINLNANWDTRAAQFAGDGQPRIDSSPLSLDSPGYAYTSNNIANWAEPTPWNGDGWSHMYTMADNFQQTFLTPAQYEPRMQEQIDDITGEIPLVNMINYQHWPEMNQYPTPPADLTNMSPTEAQYYRDTCRGVWHDWFVSLQDLLIAANPTINYTMVPVGPVVMDLWEDEVYLQGINSGVFFGDQSPHGTETLYFLAAMVCYRHAFRENPDLTGFVAPVGSNVNAAVLNNLPALITAIDARLEFYNNNGVRVYQ